MTDTKDARDVCLAALEKRVAILEQVPHVGRGGGGGGQSTCFASTQGNTSAGIASTARATQEQVGSSHSQSLGRAHEHTPVLGSAGQAVLLFRTAALAAP